MGRAGGRIVIRVSVAMRPEIGRHESLLAVACLAGGCGLRLAAVKPVPALVPPVRAGRIDVPVSVVIARRIAVGPGVAPLRGVARIGAVLVALRVPGVLRLASGLVSGGLRPSGPVAVGLVLPVVVVISLLVRGGPVVVAGGTDVPGTRP